VAITEAEVVKALFSVVDPEVGINVVDLGLVYGIEIQGGQDVRVRLGLTSPTCPLGSVIQDEAEVALHLRLPAVRGVDVEIVTEPAWSPDRMSADARRTLGLDAKEPRS
jgi:metal-sulfur cluster biosynthetic enzyme